MVTKASSWEQRLQFGGQESLCNWNRKFNLFQGSQTSKGAADNHSTPTVPMAKRIYLSWKAFIIFWQWTISLVIQEWRNWLPQLQVLISQAFSRHGIPEVVRSDNGLQYSSHEFAMFADSYGFKHVTSIVICSPKATDRLRGQLRQLLEKSSDPFMALLSYRSTPLPWCGLSPAELSMGRKVRTNVPQTNKYLIPKWSYLAEFKEKNM